jgi:hypothetical protein
MLGHVRPHGLDHLTEVLRDELVRARQLDDDADTLDGDQAVDQIVVFCVIRNLRDARVGRQRRLSVVPAFAGSDGSTRRARRLLEVGDLDKEKLEDITKLVGVIRCVGRLEPENVCEAACCVRLDAAARVSA